MEMCITGCALRCPRMLTEERFKDVSNSSSFRGKGQGCHWALEGTWVSQAPTKPLWSERKRLTPVARDNAIYIV